MAKTAKTFRKKQKKTSSLRQKRLPKMHKKHELEFRRLFNASPVGIALLKNRKIIKVNQALCRITGYSPEELEGQSARIAYRDDEEFERVGKVLFEKVASNTTAVEAGKLKKKDGTVFDGLISMSPLDPHDPSAGFVASLVDISERERAEELLRKSAEQYRVITSTSMDGFAIVDATGHLVDVNDVYCRMIGYSRDELLTMFVSDIEVNETRQEIEEHLQRTRTRSQLFESRHRRKDGRVIGVEVSMTFMEQSGHTLVFLRDITDRKRFDNELKKSAQAFERLFEATPVGIILLKDRIVLKINRALSRIGGYSPEEVEGRPVRLFYPDDEEYERVGKILFEQIARGELGITEAKLKRKDGVIVDALVCMSPLISDDPTAGVVVSVVDITDRKRTEALLEHNLRETRVRFDISQALAGKETEDEVMNILIQQANIFPEALVAIGTFERDQGKLVAILRRIESYESGVKAAVPIGTRFPVSAFPVVEKYIADRAFVATDVYTDERVDPASRALIEREGGTSLAVFRLGAGDELLGLILAVSKHSSYFDENKQHLYRTLAEQGAVALRAARMQETLRASQRRMSLLIEQSPMGIIEWNLDLEVISFNPAATQLFGYEPEEVMGRRAIGLILPETARTQLEQFVKNLPGRQGWMQTEVAQLTKDGRNIIGEWYNTPLVGPDGAVVSIVSRVQDVTERKQAEKAVLQERNFSRAALDSMPSLFYLFNEQGRFLRWNKNFAVVTGYTDEEIARMQPQDIFPESERALIFERIQEVFSTGASFVEAHLVSKDGTLTPYWFTGKLLHYEGMPCLIGMAIDISERKRAEEQLQQNLNETSVRFQISQGLAASETEDEILDVMMLYAGLFPGARTAIATVDATGDGVITLRRDSPFESGVGTFIPLGSKSRGAESPFMSLIAAIEDQSFISNDVMTDFRIDPEARALLADNRVKSLALFPLMYARETMGHLVCSAATGGFFDEERQFLYQTLAEQGAAAFRSARMRETIRASQQRLSLLIQQSPLAIIEWNLNLEVLSWNPAAELIFGYTAKEALGRHAAGLIVPATMQLQMDAILQHIVMEKASVHYVNDHVVKDGREIACEWFHTPLISPDGQVIGIISLTQDITDRKRAEKEKATLEEQLLQAQKLEAVGRLAGGVAHDFNNMLSVIIGYANLIKTQLSSDYPLMNDILEIERAAGRSREITSQLLAFSRKQTIAPKVVDLNEIITKMQRTLERLIGEDVDLKFYPGDDLWKIKFDPAQVEQILINLAANARDAMLSGGKLTIETRNVSIDEAYCKEHAEFIPGHYALLAVSDDGVGMDKETLTHAFEPFFTTKAIGKGTGLGLAMVYGIIKQNNSFINIYSEPKLGTTIKLYIPRTLEQAIIERVEPAAVTPQTGTILLVEDDNTVRQVATKMLESIGYKVLTVEKPQDALSLCEQAHTTIDVLLTDVVMPVMSGRELRDRVTALRPGIKTIFMSGYTANIIAQRGILDEDVNLLQKPFTLSELAKTISDVMGHH